MTGTNNDGTATGSDCQSADGYAWSGSQTFVTAGRVSEPDPDTASDGWLNGGGVDSCTTSYHIYCVSR